MVSQKSKKIAVTFDGKRCIHSRRCVLGLPEVFQAGAEGEWIFPENAPVDDLTEIIDSCPSGALSYKRLDGGREEQTPKVNSIRLWENGPNEFKGNLKIGDNDIALRRLLCRCGKSQRKPYCDNSHIEAGFSASSNAETVESDVPDIRDGALTITPTADGPLAVSGPLEVIAGSGRRIKTGDKHFLCRCGASKNKPFCDGSHKKIGFKSEDTSE